MRWCAVVLAALLVLQLAGPAGAAATTTLRADIPYSLTAGGSRAGSVVKALVAVENTGPAERVVGLTVSFPPGVRPLAVPEGWRSEEGQLAGDVRLPGGYGQWFDLLIFDAGGLPAGEYEFVVTMADGDRREIVRRQAPVGGSAGGSGAGLAISAVALPVDRDGKRDERLNANTIMLRDRTLDYYKSVLKGRGAYNEAAEAVHPLTYMNVTFANPSGEERLLVVSCRLFDGEGRAAPGMFTPAAGVEDGDIGGFAGDREESAALIALSGAASQTVRLPVYADEGVLAGGRYVLRVSAREGDRRVAAAELPVAVVARDSKAGLLTLAVLTLTAGGLAVAARRRRVWFAGFKTRWLITITLFGAASFAAVNVPATLLNDVLHVLLGPLAFLVTGMFHGVVLYMLLAALVALIPRPGTVSLLFAVRLLLGLAAFGHASPVVVLLYGSQAVLLEGFLFFAGITSRTGSDGAAPRASGWRGAIVSALACGAADGICTYLNLHALSFLYRFYYADWYIAAAVAVNGCLYSGLGGFCGARLGDRLRAVGSD